MAQGTQWFHQILYAIYQQGQADSTIAETIGDCRWSSSRFEISAREEYRLSRFETR